MKQLRLVILAICIVMGIGFLVGYWQYNRRDSSLEVITDRGVIRVGYSSEQPYAWVTANGEISGAFPELARRIASDIGIERIEWIQVPFDDLIPGLRSGRFDVIGAGMFITPERARLIAFAEPVLHVQQGLLVIRGNPMQLHSYQPAGAPVVIAVVAGTFEARTLPLLGLPPEQLLVVPDAATGMAAVQSGLAHGLALTDPTLRLMAAQSQGNLELAFPFEQPPGDTTSGSGYCAFEFRSGETALVQAWNDSQTRLLATPSIAQLVEANGFTLNELSDSRTFSEVQQR